jgi:hypothetical protein
MNEPIAQHAEDSVKQNGTGNVNIVLPTGSVDRVIGALQISYYVSGVAIALSVVLCLLFVRYNDEYANQAWQYNLLRSCLQSSQCDVQKVLKQLERK